MLSSPTSLFIVVQAVQIGSMQHGRPWCRHANLNPKPQDLIVWRACLCWVSLQTKLNFVMQHLLIRWRRKASAPEQGRCAWRQAPNEDSLCYRELYEEWQKRYNVVVVTSTRDTFQEMFDNDDTLAYEPGTTAAVIMCGGDEEAEAAAREVCLLYLCLTMWSTFAGHEHAEGVIERSCHANMTCCT